MLNLPGMIRIVFTLLLIGAGNSLFAQYLHYWDDHKRFNDDNKRYDNTRPANINTVPAKVTEQKVIYHHWPDRCPGLSSSIPVLKSYVPRELVLKLTEKYKGYLYAITSVKGAGNKREYKLKVCADGAIKYEYADETGDVIKK